MIESKDNLESKQSEQIINENNKENDLSLQNEKKKENGKKRILFVDNIRIFLTILVILHHVAIAYSGGVGDWYYYEVPSDEISPILFILFQALNQAYFMSFFFMIGGYFLVKSLKRKGPVRFIVGRLIRFGIPFLFFVIYLSPLIDWLGNNYLFGNEVNYFELFKTSIISGYNHTGPLWFLEALFIFSLIYVLIKIIKDKIIEKKNIPLKQSTENRSKFPSNKKIWIIIPILSILTFIVRFEYPVGESFLNEFQLAHFTHYIFCFISGIIAYNQKWLDIIPKNAEKIWRTVSLITILMFFPLIALGGALEGGFDPFMGGLEWQALVYNIWESILCISMIIWLACLFRRKFNTQGKFLKKLSPNVLTVYVINPPIILGFALLFMNVPIPTPLKFVIVSVIGVVLSFLLAISSCARFLIAKKY